MTSFRWPDEHYEQVAEVYLEAIEAREPVNAKGASTPGVAVAEAWGLPMSTAYRWIKEAKRRGLLSVDRRCSCRCPVHCPSD